jgi:Domain of unknown function (DUF5664)
MTEGKKDIDYILANDPFLTETFHKIQLDTSNLIDVDSLAISQDPNHTGGRKFDGGKLQYSLLPPLALEDVVKVLTFGAQKYEPDNWKRVPDAKRRYFDAAQRHIWAYKAGEINDPESGVNHLAHAVCCLMFINDLDNSGD